MAGQGASALFFTHAFGLAAFVTLSSGSAFAEDYPACAKFSNPLAYNQCLATYGPVAHGTRAITPPPDGGDGPRGAWASHRHGAQSMQVTRGRRGRMVLELSVGASPAGTRGPKKVQ